VQLHNRSHGRPEGPSLVRGVRKYAFISLHCNSSNYLTEVDNFQFGTGSGQSRRSAKEAAASNALATLKQGNYL
jgi:hypothetical protein